MIVQYGIDLRIHGIVAGFWVLCSQRMVIIDSFSLDYIIFLSPYTLSVIYWGMTKLREKNWEWYDEKQQRDVGRLAF